MNPVPTVTGLQVPVCGTSTVTHAFFVLLGDNYKKHLNIKRYAALIGVTANHLIKSVRHSTGKTPLQWMHQVLLQEASAMLESGCRVKEIAVTLGYRSLANFNHFIKLQTGYSPTGYKFILDKRKHVLNNRSSLAAPV